MDLARQGASLAKSEISIGLNRATKRAGISDAKKVPNSTDGGYAQISTFVKFGPFPDSGLSCHVRRIRATSPFYRMLRSSRTMPLTVSTCASGDCQCASVAAWCRQYSSLSGFLMTRATRRIAFSLGMIASVASAQSNPAISVFFGFDFVLHPIAIKWACEGSREEDLTAFETLIAAFPEDAKSAELRTHIDAFQHISTGDEGIAQILGREVTNQQAEHLCAAARHLSVAWVTPEQLVNDDEHAVPTEQRAAWAEFWKVVESLQ